MPPSTYTAFQRHLVFFSTPTTRPQLTLLSGTRAAISLGLNLPIAILLSLSLRLLYAPYPHMLSPINIEKIPDSMHRTQLCNARLSPSKPAYTCSELLALLSSSEPSKGFLQRIIDQGHIIGFWTMAANTQTHTVSRDDVERFQEGGWEEMVAMRRRQRHDVLPFWRGGPIAVGLHSLAVRRLLGVGVYEGRRGNWLS